MNTAPGIIPCSNSSSSRTSRKVDVGRRRSASAGSISSIALLAWFSSSRKLGMSAPRKGDDRGKSLPADSGIPNFLHDGRKSLSERGADDDVGQVVERCGL